MAGEQTRQPEQGEQVEETVSSAERFANAVVRKHVMGKLRAGTKINGVNVEKEKEGEHNFHGTDLLTTLTPLENNGFIPGNIVRLADFTSGERQGKFADLMKFHLVSVMPSEAGSGNMLLGINFYQDRHQIDSRGYYTVAHALVELPDEMMKEFLKEIQKNPDLLEDFYQKTFVGLDSQNGSLGMRRAKADGFFLISGDKLAEAKNVARDNAKATIAFFDSLKKHRYQHGPYGTGYAFEPKST